MQRVKIKQFVVELVKKHQYQTTRLLEMLRELQSRYYYIPSEAIEQIAELLQIPRTQIISVIEFYSFFHLSPRGQYHILISDSITDHMMGKLSLMDYMVEKLGVGIGEVRADGLVSLDNTSCTGLCDQGPAGLVNGYALTRLNKNKINLIADLINQHKPLEQWPQTLFQVDDNIYRAGLLLNCNMLPGDGLNAAFKRGLTETLDEIEYADLKGRGGAGFKTATKWLFCVEEKQTERYVVCNADEGEPGTFKDRVLLNSYADQVFEGMTLCAAIIGADQGFLYLRGEYLFLYNQIQQVLQQRRDQNLLGKGILGKAFSFDIEIRLGAGAYICGEETALIESLEGKQGIPRNRPPFPVTSGYLGKPTVVNNVETFIAASAIALHGGAWFANHGTRVSKGTKILSISGDCERPGIYEYPFGTNVQQILDECGSNDAMGVQIGGPSGSYVSDVEFERKLAFEDLSTGGSFIVFNRSRNMLDMVQNFTHFFAHESCGFCTPCRVGTSLLKKQLDKIYDGHGSAGDVVELERLCQLVNTTSHCGLGQTAANPILTTLQRYPEHYQQLLKTISYEPGFDLDAALQKTRELTGRDDAEAHLSQTGEKDEWHD